MTLYQLYLESGPRRKKTMVHVLELLGCVVSGPTIVAALERTPAAIRDYLRFLQRQGEPVDPDGQLKSSLPSISWMAMSGPGKLIAFAT